MTENQACLELETIAALVDGTISRRERSRLERHLASCEECCTVLAEAIRDRDERRGIPVTRVAAPRAMWIAGGLAAAILAGVVVWPYLERRLTGGGPILRGVAPLVSVAVDRRSVDARITGGFPWVPLDPLERSGTSPRTTPAWEILAAASRIRKDAEADPSPENRHALGVAHLVLGNLDEAVAVLRAANGDSPSNATLLNDLGAALLARGEIQARPDDLIEALSCIEKALESNRSLKEALFNRAVALEKLHLDEKAAAAWVDYLSREPEPGWADEARQRLEALKEAKESGSWDRDRDRIEEAVASASSSTVEEIVGRRTQETRLWVQDALLGAWARAARDGRAADAESALATATTLAEALEATTADPLTRHIASMVREAAGRGPSVRLDALIRGHLAYQSGVERFDRFEIGAAQPFYVEAQAALAAAGSPMALWASFGAARCEYYRGELGAASRRLDLVLPEAELKSYLALSAHTNWLRGLIDVVQNRLDGSLARYQRALATFERLREVEHSAFVCSLVAENLGLLGDERESLRKILDALSRINRVRSPGRVVVILLQAAIAASRQGFPGVALEFANAAVETAKQGGDAIDIADSLQRRAVIASELGRFDAARSDLAAAREWVPRIADPVMRNRLDAELLSADCGLVGRGGNPAQAELVLTEAIGFFSRAGFEIRLPELYLERARASRAQGDVDATERDLKAAIEIFERHRLEILGQTLRVSYFDTAHDLFDELMSLEIDRGRPDAALQYLERGKTRDVLDRWRTAKPLAVELLPEAIPEGVAIIAYGVLPDRLLVWTLSHGSRELTEEPIAARELTRLVKKFRDELEIASAEAPLPAAARLYEVLIDPIAPRLAGFGTVVVIPDESLHAVPFAALANAKTNRFLVEDHPIVVAPSIALFLQATNNLSAKASRVPPTLLAIGDPAFDASAFPYLPRLSGAAAEAKRIARFYSDAVVLTGDAAVPHRFLSEIGRHTVVHVASHALTNENDPLRSRLLLAPDPEHQDSGTLFAEDLYGKSFGQVRLVVLAACSTASGRISRGEGPLSLARPFLAGGVPAVLATMWEIEDAPSSELLTAFHRQIAAGRPPEEALRDAQVALIQGNDPALRAPRSWAAFQLAGGVDRSIRG